ncbi:arsenite methyltransferase-like isoform X2 [Nerophis lumbriciformis]|uniref:arsenite methyltransferase-like isoform X2 n=1 Tax=Nerophis lumbriciformis TaxID=546530 RepID=UPI002ADF803F|nr:arsenite methyltransferase-like isoform X2 [Nerophis lumbriciformis]
MSDKTSFVDTTIHLDVKDYYGKTLKNTSDLKSNACVAPARPLPKFILQALKKVHPDVTDRYYGCGLVVPECLEGCRILDLGSGSGRDCYMLSQLVGETGHVTGIDMTEDQEGGELYFSDVYSNGRLTEEIKNHKVLWGECLGGALWFKDLLQLAKEVGFSPPRLVQASIITVDNKELQDILGDFKFVSATYRLFKVPKGSTKPCKVMYNGNITGAEETLRFDCQYTFKADQVVEVDAEVASILTHSRFAQEFTFQPPGGSCEPCGVRPKAGTEDPFELAEQLLKQGPGSATGGCCGTKSATCCK